MLAVIGVLTAILMPKVFQAIDQARINQAVIGINTVKTACVEHFARFGSMPIDGSAQPATPIIVSETDDRALHFDRVLLAEQLLEKLFQVNIGTGSIELHAGEPADTAVTGDNSAYNLDGGSPPNDAQGTVIVVAVITDVLLEDARALNRIIDNTSSSSASDEDLAGQVKYAKPAKVKTSVKTKAQAARTNNDATGGKTSDRTANDKPPPGGNNGHHYAYGHNREGAVDVHVYLTHR